MTDATEPASRVWQVGALCRAVADALDARFNPVSVAGEISGFNRAVSGHTYFALKDDSGQIRCAMFRRAAGLLPFAPRDGMRVEIEGRLAVYEPRGDLQLIVEAMRQAGAGTLFEQFLRLKALLEGQGLFDPARKRALVAMPRAIGVVTSIGAAALRDVVTALQRRAPHVPVILAPASVQGPSAAGELAAALESLYRWALNPSVGHAPIDTILLVRGGGSLEDLWSFNDERLARVIARSPVPVVSGVGHETDFTIADWVADVRAPTPTAAAELAAMPLTQWTADLALLEGRIGRALRRHLDTELQRVDRTAARLGRPSGAVAVQRQWLVAQRQRLRHAALSLTRRRSEALERLAIQLERGRRLSLDRHRERLDRVAVRLSLLDPALVLRRGYAWLQDEAGRVVTRADAVQPGQVLRASLAEGRIDLTVRPRG